MKITWFGARTLRVYIGGGILLWSPSDVDGVAPEELRSGADVVVDAQERLPQLDATAWRPQRPATALEEAGRTPDVRASAVGDDAALVDAAGEAPLVLLGGEAPAAGRWSRDAVVVAFSAAAAQSALEVLAPRLIALAADETELDTAFGALRERLGDTALVVLEPGLAVEI